jgi:alkanesulfonate monooxygenase SsuD/methylene tetrahydromethanopterin reductase-like flavin-dependent oxidoreductase (luciferase family)
MKFAVMTHIALPEGKDPKQRLDELIDEVQYAEALGFSSAWHAEQHFTRFGIGSSALVVASHLAARTSAIRLGTSVMVPPLHHPIRLAEDTATMDLLSGGRLDVGYGRGGGNFGYEGFDIPREQSLERFKEVVTIVQNLWTTRDYSYDGTYYKVCRVNLVPAPLQKPHPPVYIGTLSTGATMEFLVSMGYTLIVGPVLDTAIALELCRGFVSMSQAAGHAIPMSQIPLFRFLHLAETQEQARREAEASLRWWYDMTTWRRTFQEGSEYDQSLEAWRQTLTQPTVDLDHVYEHRAFIGTPDQCIAKIQGLQEQGIDYFGCNFAFSCMEHDKVMRSMQLFATEVMPHFISKFRN